VKRLLKILVFSPLLFIGRPCHAGMNLPSLTYSVGIAAAPMSFIQVSSGPTNASQMDNPPLTNRAVVDIQNVDTTANLWCTVVSTTPALGKGNKISPGAHLVFNIRDKIALPGASPTTASWWCINDLTTATSSATVTQLY
jgi:hypothetical protein